MKQLNRLYVYNCMYLVYRKIYRKILLLILFSSAITLYAQSTFADGIWNGKITLLDDSSSINIRFTVINDQLTEIYDESRTDSWFKKATLVQRKENGNIIFWWTHNCEFGTQSKVFKFVLVTPDSATVVWLQNLVIYGQKPVSKNDWDILGSGFVTKTSSMAYVRKGN